MRRKTNGKNEISYNQKNTYKKGGMLTGLVHAMFFLTESQYLKFFLIGWLQW